jgi:hypothetical protein
VFRGKNKEKYNGRMDVAEAFSLVSFFFLHWLFKSKYRGGSFPALFSPSNHVFLLYTSCAHELFYAYLVYLQKKIEGS